MTPSASHKECNTPTSATYSQGGVITPTPVPDNAKLITTQSTSTLYVAGYQTTDSLGMPTSILPSTLYVVKNVAITEPAAATTIVSDSTTLHDFNSHGFWGVIISLVIVTTTLIFMVVA
ncbi:hypothetical protein C1645_837672 [Glomus cerebriforme]|uniref:Uncharacterized protein n=1 Tax=Glomus cerebriforme TaxID=658196 RepID=A0A397SF19_9GLOM|nr:hypothetical protein C1645_837672 [Glomus cerebriforme]